jgi:hypothetical protein
MASACRKSQRTAKLRTSPSVRCGAIQGRPAVSLIPLHLKADAVAAALVPLVCIHQSAALFACVPTVKQLISLRYYVSHPSTHILTAGSFICSFLSCFIISCHYHLFCFSFHSFFLFPPIFCSIFYNLFFYSFLCSFIPPPVRPLLFIFLPFVLGKWRRDNSVTVVTRPRNRGSVPGKGRRCLFFSQLSDRLWIVSLWGVKR